MRRGSSSPTTATTDTATGRWRGSRSLRCPRIPPRWALHPSEHPRSAPGVVEEEVSRSAVILLSMGNLTGGQRQALFELLGSRPGARSLGDVRDATGREGVGVALPLAQSGSELRVIIDPKTSDILQSTEVLPPPPVEAPHVAGAPRQPP